MDKILENIDSKVTKVESSNHQVMNMMKMLQTQFTQFAKHFTSNEGKLPGQPRNPESAKAIKKCSGMETEDPEHPAGARKPKPVVEAEMTSKEKTPTPSPEIEMEEPELDINMPLLDALQVPYYTCYFKDILTNKREIQQFTIDHIKMTEEWSVAIANQAPKEKRDPRCPTISGSIGVLTFEMALCDLGTSVSIMPKAVFEKLRLLEQEQIAMCLELADNTIHYPEGIAEDVHVKIGNHFVPIGFVRLEMGEGGKSLLILGRPFLKTARANIDIGKGEIKFDINGTMSTFKFHPGFEEEKNKKAEEKKPAEVAIVQ
nr:uncharacterized protein LOC117854631 [Setaria viridis]